MLGGLQWCHCCACRRKGNARHASPCASLHFLTQTRICPFPCNFIPIPDMLSCNLNSNGKHSKFARDEWRRGEQIKRSLWCNRDNRSVRQRRAGRMCKSVQLVQPTCRWSFVLLCNKTLHSPLKKTVPGKEMKRSGTKTTKQLSENLLGSLPVSTKKSFFCRFSPRETSQRTQTKLENLL